MPLPLPPPVPSPCIVVGCNSSGPQHNFFCMPKNEMLIEKWLINMNRFDLMGNPYTTLKHYVVCDLHFSGKCFQNYLRLKLNRGVVPTILNPSAENENVSQQPTPTVVGNEESSEPGRILTTQKSIMKEIQTCGSNKTDLKESTVVDASNNKHVPAIIQKRPGPPIIHLDRKISRPTPAPFVIKTAVPARPALYVYKASLNLLKEQHNLSATHHGELKEKSSTIDEESEHLDTSNKQLTVDLLEQTRSKLEQLQETSGREIAKLQRDLKEVRSQNEEMCRKLNGAMSKLINCEERLKVLEVENVKKTKFYILNLKQKTIS